MPQGVLVAVACDDIPHQLAPRHHDRVSPDRGHARGRQSEGDDGKLRGRETDEGVIRLERVQDRGRHVASRRSAKDPCRHSVTALGSARDTRRARCPVDATRAVFNCQSSTMSRTAMSFASSRVLKRHDELGARISPAASSADALRLPVSGSSGPGRTRRRTVQSEATRSAFVVRLGVAVGLGRLRPPPLVTFAVIVAPTNAVNAAFRHRRLLADRAVSLVRHAVLSGSWQRCDRRPRDGRALDSGPAIDPHAVLVKDHGSGAERARLDIPRQSIDTRVRSEPRGIGAAP